MPCHGQLKMYSRDFLAVFERTRFTDSLIDSFFSVAFPITALAALPRVVGFVQFNSLLNTALILFGIYGLVLIQRASAVYRQVHAAR